MESLKNKDSSDANLWMNSPWNYTPDIFDSAPTNALIYAFNSITVVPSEVGLDIYKILIMEKFKEFLNDNGTL